MATFGAQITDLVGGSIDQTACDQWAVNGSREIINSLPSNLLEHCADKSSDITSSSGLALGGAVGKILYVTRLDGSYEQPCRLLLGSQGDLADDSTAVSYYATSNDPAYFIRDNTIFVKPNPTASLPGRVYYLNLPTSIDVSADSAITNFPDEAEYLVVLYAAIQQLAQYMADEVSNEDSELYALHSDRYTKLSAEYQKGLAFLSGAATSRGR